MISLPYFAQNYTDPLLKQLLMGTNEAILCESFDGQVQAVNARFLALVGWTCPYQGESVESLLACWTSKAVHPQALEAYFSSCRSENPPTAPVELQPNSGQTLEARFVLSGESDRPLRLWFFQEWRTSALAWVSHEIKNPLNAVLGFSELLSESLDNQSASEAVRESLRGLRIGAKHLHSVMGDLLDFSRLESGVVEPHPEWTPLKSFLDEILTLFRTRFQRRGLQFQVQCNEDPSVELWIDSRRLFQILGNLLSNALRFTKRGWVALKVIRDQRAWVFSVEDSGVGIPSDQQAKIFEPFVQQQDQDRSQFGGSGLGLAICRTLTLGLGGRLSLESELGVGSRFSVRFEELRQRQQMSKAPPPSRPGVARAVLLVADDEPSNHLLVKGFLRGTSVTLLFANDGKQAVELWKTHRPRAVLMDLRMPGFSGLEAARRIRAFDHPVRTKLLAMSATPPSTAEASEGRLLWSGFLEKPFAKQDFLKFLSNHLSFVDEFASSP